jgi:exodeoxyribonuclease V alpha subunit
MGKTWTVRSILALRMIQQHLQSPKQPLRIALAAPTGKAASRMKESLCDELKLNLIDKLAPLLPQGLSSQLLHDQLLTLETSTIHRLLGYNPQIATQFLHRADNPLPIDILVIDEASMIDLALFSKLMAAIPPATQVIILGDPNQLTSVEAGTVLGDICATHDSESLSLRADTIPLLNSLGMQPKSTTCASSKIGNCIIALNKTFRFEDDARIGQFAQRCVQRPFNISHTAATLIDSGEFSGSALIPHAKSGLASAARRLILKELTPYIDLLKQGPNSSETEQMFHQKLLERFHTFRILCAHRKGEYGVEQMNELVSGIVKQLSENQSADEHWYGRPIMVRRNDKTTGRFNGDIGLVVARRMEDGSNLPTIVFPSNTTGEGNSVAYIAPALLPAHETAFAMTIHKSQGSEFKHAMLIFPKQLSPILTRELIYTGVTRAKEQITLLSNEDAMLAGLSKTVQRASGLTHLLQLDEST